MEMIYFPRNADVIVPADIHFRQKETPAITARGYAPADLRPRLKM